MLERPHKYSGSNTVLRCIGNEEPNQIFTLSVRIMLPSSPKSKLSHGHHTMITLPQKAEPTGPGVFLKQRERFSARKDVRPISFSLYKFPVSVFICSDTVQYEDGESFTRGAGADADGICCEIYKYIW